MSVTRVMRCSGGAGAASATYTPNAAEPPAQPHASTHSAVTGAAGNIGYALLFRLAAGNCFGADQPIILQLVEIPPGMKALEGVSMELMAPSGRMRK